MIYRVSILFAATVLLGCNDEVIDPQPNRAPTAGQIPLQTLHVGDQRNLDLSGHFADPDGDVLTYRAVTAQPTLVSVSVSDAVLDLTALLQGEAEVTVTASDPEGLTASSSVKVVIPNRPPVAADTLADRRLPGPGRAVVVEISGVFSDPDGDALIFAASSSDTSVVAVSLSVDTLTLTGGSAGGAGRVTLTARDPEGAEAIVTLGVVVNRRPQAFGEIPGQMLVAETPPLDLDVSGVFSDPDGDALTFAASSSDTSVVTVLVSSAVLIVEAQTVHEDRAEVAVTARDPDGLQAGLEFSVTITENPDRAALVALYETTDGPSWTNNDNWLTDAPLAEWYGVGASEDAWVRVLGLRLSGNNLTGPIPPELGNLAALEDLRLSENEGLTDALPTTLKALRGLSRLTTSGTGLCAPAVNEFQWWARARALRIRQCSSFGAAYLVQSVQSWEYPVPLVAGRDALLRVFPTAPVGAGVSIPVPPVRASFYDSGETAPFHTVEIPSKPGPLSTEIDEGELAVSANVEIPGEVLRPGLEMVVEIDPQGTLDSASRRIPAQGRTTLEIHALPAMELTLVPFLWTQDPDSSVVVTVDELAADPEGHELMHLLRALLPTHEWTVTAHEPVWMDVPLDKTAILSRTGALQSMEGGRGHWMGTASYVAGGVAHQPGSTSASALYAPTMAHELGHNLSLGHADCGSPGSVDDTFPHGNGTIGAWGYDFATGNLVPPRRPDVMSYCRRAPWISDYHFGNALGHRLRILEHFVLPTRALLLWGGTDAESGPHLEPAFVVDAAPSLPVSDGPWTIEGRNAGGRVLFTLSFAMPEIADAGEGAGGFAYTLPIRSGWEALASVTLSGPGGTATLDESTDRPMSIYRDGDGKVRAILQGDPVQADGTAGGLLPVVALNLVTSRGIPSLEAWQR